MNRTPYRSSPFDEDVYRRSIGPNKYLMEDGYIFDYQDVRGRWNSEGEGEGEGGVYDNMRAYIPNKKR